MSNAMTEIRATANAHMRRDLEAGPKWACECDACVQIRSLVGVEKMLDVRPLVREIEHLGTRLDELPAGPERQLVLEQYLGLHDRLADVVAE
jgi:hypothetical protein